MKCRRCKGTGIIKYTLFGKISRKWCPDCNGTGYSFGAIESLVIIAAALGAIVLGYMLVEAF